MTSYATPLELSQFMGIEGIIPDISIVSGDRLKEEVGAGTATQTRFFLDQAYVITDSYNIKYGPSESQTGTTLTENTHYTLNKDRREITLTGAGTAEVGTNNIYAEYSYNKIGLTDTQITDALNRAAQGVDSKTNTNFTIAGTTTPTYIQSTNEEHMGKGRFDKEYFLDNFPIPEFSTKLTQAMGATAVTIFADDTTGFPERGVFLIESDKISYGGKQVGGSAFTGCSASVGHLVGTEIQPIVIEISGTYPGTDPVWEVISKDSEFDVDFNSGRISLYRSDRLLSTLSLTFPPAMVPNRFRASYLSGYSDTPEDIKHLTLMLASKDLLHLAVRKAQSSGFNDFRPEQINIDDDFIEKVIAEYHQERSKNV